MVAPDGYPFKPEFNLALVEFNNVSAGRTGIGNMNYLTFMKNSKTLGKIISCKRLPQVNKFDEFYEKRKVILTSKLRALLG